MRLLLALLLLANALFFGWSQGWLDHVTGLRATGDREPERMARQTHPERVQLLSPQAATALQEVNCLELGPVTADASATLLGAGVLASEWSEQQAPAVESWGVVTIKLATKDFAARKEETYKHLHVAFEPLPGHPEEQPSLLLSRHASRAEAEKALDVLNRHSLKGLRVLQLDAPGPALWLRFDHADATREQQLRTLAASELAGASVRACAVAPAGAASAVSAVSAASTVGMAPPAFAPSAAARGKPASASASK